MSSARLDDQRLDILMALNLVEQMLSGPGTKERRLVMRVALSLANQAKALRVRTRHCGEPGCVVGVAVLP